MPKEIKEKIKGWEKETIKYAELGMKLGLDGEQIDEIQSFVKEEKQKWAGEMIDKFKEMDLFCAKVNIKALKQKVGK